MVSLLMMSGDMTDAMVCARRSEGGELLKNDTYRAVIETLRSLPLILILRETFGRGQVEVVGKLWMWICIWLLRWTCHWQWHNVPQRTELQISLLPVKKKSLWDCNRATEMKGKIKRCGRCSKGLSNRGTLCDYRGALWSPISLRRIELLGFLKGAAKIETTVFLHPRLALRKTLAMLPGSERRQSGWSTCLIGKLAIWITNHSSHAYQEAALTLER
ncbi:uncharacterized protein BJ212DRAFT_1550025 [Suillus subaureus]|uniref:Uncharacterized protein n=1 Tax=Suillus subaureus TaxID=48587 RepID=A0A9P7JG89_9AGAM|nr:uncharacterized protein BJ212DRAFT_1550025 [Suillus subaureus]KAG1820886.1 hypothetical protein BJ212DRAFT_1550025 [Suillus subaureus]